MLSAQSPKYPALYDDESGVRFNLGHAAVTELQALKLAERAYVDGILIGSFDEDGRPVDGRPAKDWAKEQRRSATEEAGGSGTGAQDPPAGATPVARKTRSK